ncbi:MAG: iron-sulfur cluster insertion protein ErpA [Proteobacteria bacterium]|nr:iron-sulfur cluster insertion protein ErpA [Pseudomonadota bacterium]
MLHVTDEAKAEIVKALDGKGDDPVVRVFVAGYGCGGASLGLTIDEHQEGDIRVDFDGCSVVMESELDVEMSGVTVDYRNSENGSGFVLKPGRVQSGCGSCSCH